MNNLEIVYSYFSQKPAIRLNGENIGQHSDLPSMLGNLLLRSALDVIREFDESEIDSDYEIDIYSTPFQYEIISAAAKASQYCKAVRFHPMQALMPVHNMLQRLEGICAERNIRAENRDPVTVYNAAGVDVPQYSFLSVTGSPKADLGLFRDSADIPSSVSFPVVIADTFAVSGRPRKNVCCVPDNSLKLFWEYCLFEFLAVPVMSEYMTALNHVSLDDAQRIEVNAIKTGNPDYYIGEIPELIDMGDSVAAEFKSFPEGYFSLSSDNPQTADFDDGRITAYAAGEAVLAVTDQNQNRVTSRKITVIEHNYAREIRLVPRFKRLSRNERGQIDVIVTPSNAEDAGRLSWEVSDSRILQVSSDGSVVALEEGSASITVRGHKAAAKLTVDIKPHVRRLSFSSEGIRLKGGETVVIECQITPDGASAENLVWELDNRTIASINPSLDGRKCQITASATYEGSGNIRCYDPETRTAAVMKLEVTTTVKHTAAGKIALGCTIAGIFMFFPLFISIIAGVMGLMTDDDPDRKPRYIWCTAISVVMLLIWLSGMR